MENMMNKIDERMENFTASWNLWKNQVDILDVKNTESEIMNSLDGFNSRLYTKRGQK